MKFLPVIAEEIQFKIILQQNMAVD